MPGIFGNSKKSSIEVLLSCYGNELPETREIDETFLKGIELANSGSWEEAAAIFRIAQQLTPDYDVPHLWLADYLKQDGQIFLGVKELQESAEQCRRKHYLLEKAGEFSLLNLGNTIDAMHFFAQAISVMVARPARGDTGGKRPFLFMKAFFERCRDTKGVKWADSIIAGEFSLTYEMIRDIQEDPFVSSVSNEISEIRNYLVRRFPT